MTYFDPDESTARVSDNQIEVPGSPEEVWRAVATGPGISTWFVPAEVQEHEGGRIITDHGPYGRSEGVVTHWEPNHRFGYEERDWNPDRPDAPVWATELLIEARDGGTCVVRLISGFFSDGEGWEDELKGTDEGWVAALRNLRLSLTYFPGLAAAMMTVDGSTSDRTPDELSGQFLAALNLTNAAVGDAVRLQDHTPGLSGTVVDRGPRSVTLRAGEPHQGIVEFGTFDHSGATAAIRWYLYGPGGAECAATAAPRWARWLGEHVDGLSGPTATSSPLAVEAVER